MSDDLRDCCQCLTWHSGYCVVCRAATELARLGRTVEAMRGALEAAHAMHEARVRRGWERWSEGGWIWNDDIWRESDPDGFALALQIRAALAGESPDKTRDG